MSAFNRSWVVLGAPEMDPRCVVEKGCWAKRMAPRSEMAASRCLRSRAGALPERSESRSFHGGFHRASLFMPKKLQEQDACLQASHLPGNTSSPRRKATSSLNTSSDRFGVMPLVPCCSCHRKSVASSHFSSVPASETVGAPWPGQRTQ